MFVLPAQADDRLLTVRLASGRHFTAQVDAKTDDLLWLRFSKGGGNLLRPIAWDRVIAAELDGKKVELQLLRDVCKDLKSAAPPKEALPVVAEAIPPAPAPLVTSIRIDAWLANWDADVETDGICVMLQPLDENGQLVPVSGTAVVELFAAQRRKFNEAPQSGGWMTELMQRWSETFQPEQIGTNGIQLRLPFAALHPEFDSGVDNFGLVHVRLVVPGSGVFEQSLDGVKLRNWSPVRSGMFLQNGQRFFSTERTNRN
ncbi:MAG: hypothetical protein K8R36_01970 [Planctomycetales bacterium]|nr:hypothetical protein [Planctomycetales bacterium]